MTDTPANDLVARLRRTAADDPLSAQAILLEAADGIAAVTYERDAFRREIERLCQKLEEAESQLLPLRQQLNLAQSQRDEAVANLKRWEDEEAEDLRHFKEVAEKAWSQRDALAEDASTFVAFVLRHTLPERAKAHGAEA